MIRDGRAAVHSMISRKVTISGYDLKSYRQSLSKWNSTITAMNNQCNELGPNSCLKVYYEQLVLHPRSWMTKILKFLDLPWNENVMHHEKQINQPNGISLSKVEMSTDQVQIYLIYNYSQSSIIRNLIIGSSQYRDFFNGHYLLRISGFSQEKFDYQDFSRKILIIEVNKCSVVNLKIQLLGFFEIFGHSCPDNRGPPV
jgi:hypothetical protein